MIQNPHSLSIQEITDYLNVDLEKGLRSHQVKYQRKIHGTNTLKQKKAKGIWVILLEQFLDPIIYLLFVAMILGFYFSEWLEGFAVLIVILITVMIGFFMEWHAMRSVEALQKITQTVALVLRNGKQKKLQAHLLVPGDIIYLNSGDVVPADARLVKHQSLATKEASLTGESNQVEKSLETLPLKTTLAERYNMVFNGTIVVRGEAKAIVTATGDNTCMGKISSLTQAAQKERSPLEKKINKLSRWLIVLTLILASIITITGYIQGKDLMLMVKIGIALAVAAIPEGLPIVATIALARGMVKLSKRKVIIKKLEAVQTLGEVTIICTDKTGTLTKDKISARSLLLDSAEFHVNDLNNPETLSILKQNLSFLDVINVAVLCNNIKLEQEQTNGDSIEIALLEFAKKTGFNIKEIRALHEEIIEIPFDAHYKLMATLNYDGEQYLVCVKGAFERLVEISSFIKTKDGIEPFKNKEIWLDLNQKLANEGLRILAFANKSLTEKPNPEDMLQDLCFLGLIGFLDPPRTDVKQAIQTYKDAGINVVMITGDHPATARKIAEDINLLNIDEGPQKVIHGNTILEIDKLSKEKEAILLNASVFARMIPEQKLDLVEFYQKHNQIVGMIGDGVNDAPALKKADIGIAMGIRGTEAAREVADVILMDDKFTSTELAIRQGRTIYENIRHFVVYLLSCNLAEIISVAIASLSNLPLPLLPLQILFLNLVTDVFPALALGMGKGEEGIMKQLPRNPKEPIITIKHWVSAGVYGLSITTAVIGVTIYAHYVLEASYQVVNNMAFYTLVLGQLLNVFNIPHRNISFFKNEVTTNPWIWGALLLSILILVLAYEIPILERVLSLVTLTSLQFLIVGLFGIVSLVLTQIIKRLGGTL